MSKPSPQRARRQLDLMIWLVLGFTFIGIAPFPAVVADLIAVFLLIAELVMLGLLIQRFKNKQ
jgi:hypothetical protein